jgi:polyisoprenoid-binding protein YceI
MDKNMHKAMEADKFAGISFSLKSYTVAGDEVTAKGALTIHGVTKDVELKGKLQAKGEGIQVTGQFDSLMNDWGIKPPVMMMGTVRVADKISIAYDYDLSK